jgi:hypothetical protein
MSGLAIGALIGAGVGGASAALQHKDIGQGALYGGLMGAATGGIGGAMGGAGAAVGSGLAEGAVGSAVGDGIGGMAAGEAGAINSTMAFENALPQATGIDAIPRLGSGMTPGAAQANDLMYANQVGATPSTNAFDVFKSDPMKYLGDNKMLLGAGAIGGSMAGGNQPKGPDMGTIRPYQYTAGLNPGYTGSGTPYFNQSYKALPTYSAAEGGIVGLAGGGSAVSDYNNMLMQRAQQEYVNSPQLPAFRSQLPAAQAAPQAAPQAPTGAELTFDPVSRKYISAAAPKPEAVESGISNLPSMASTGNNQVGSGGGDANGGLLRAYAMGGGIGSNYGGPDTEINYDNGGPLSLNQGMQYPMQGNDQNFAAGGISHLGGYSDGGRLLKGPGDGVSDDIPAQIGDRQPARLADGEFVVPARIVSELGNGSTDAGARRLYAMMDRVQANRGKTVGKGKVAVNSKSDKYLPA